LEQKYLKERIAHLLFISASKDWLGKGQAQEDIECTGLPIPNHKAARA